MSRRFFHILQEQMEEPLSQSPLRVYRVMSSPVPFVQWCRRRNLRRGIVVLLWCLIQRVSPTRLTAAGNTQETAWTPYPFPTSWNVITRRSSVNTTWSEREMEQQGRVITSNKSEFLHEVLRDADTAGNFFWKVEPDITLEFGYLWRSMEPSFYWSRGLRRVQYDWQGNCAEGVYWDSLQKVVSTCSKGRVEVLRSSLFILWTLMSSLFVAIAGILVSVSLLGTSSSAQQMFPAGGSGGTSCPSGSSYKGSGYCQSRNSGQQFFPAGGSGRTSCPSGSSYVGSGYCKTR